MTPDENDFFSIGRKTFNNHKVGFLDPVFLLEPVLFLSSLRQLLIGHIGLERRFEAVECQAFGLFSPVGRLNSSERLCKGVTRAKLV